MKESALLTTASLLLLLLLTFHLTDDVVRGFEPGGPKNLWGLLIMGVWLYATLMLRERRLGNIIILLGSLLGAFVPYVHMQGAGMVGGRIANSSGMFFWVWTLLAIGAIAPFSAILAARALWPWRRARE